MAPDRLRALCALPLVAAVGLAGPAGAHTALSSSTPAPGATVPASTSEVVLRFTGGVRSGLSAVAVTGPSGDDHAEGPVQERDGAVVQQVRGPLPAGSWTLAYRVVARDGHPLTGTVRFAVTPDGVPASPAASASTTPPAAARGTAPAQQQRGPGLLPLVALASAAAGVALWRYRRARA